MNRGVDPHPRFPGPAPDDPLASDDLLAAALETLRDTAPAKDLWPGIRVAAAPAAGRRVVSFTLPQLAMAATLLVAVSAAVSWLALGPQAVTPGSQGPAIRAVIEPIESVQPDVQRATFADEQYDAAVADLERILRDDRQRLDPQTVMVIERNLRAIDDAIQQSRAALDADPANTYLNTHLADARRRKLELLRRAAGLSQGGD